MTEQEWLGCTDPASMLEFLQGKASARKLRLFLTAICRMAVKDMVDQRSRQAVEVAERYSDGEASELELNGARWGADLARDESWSEKGLYAADMAGIVCARPDHLDWASKYPTADDRCAALEEQAMILRDLFGNPFGTILLDPSWLTSTVRRLAETIYQGKAFDRLPFLADALEDAGCSSKVILKHLRRRGEHVRGCWALDLILSKE